MRQCGASGARAHVHVRRFGLRVDEHARRITNRDRRCFFTTDASSSPHSRLVLSYLPIFQLSFPFRARIRSHDMTEPKCRNRVSLSDCIIGGKKKTEICLELPLSRN